MKQTILTLLACFALSASAQQLPYQNPQLTAEQRADDLLPRLTLEEKVRLMMDSSPAIERLGIPQFQWWNEALHGVGRNGYATVFPITMGMAASWDDELLHQVFTAVSDEARAKAQKAKQSGNIKRYQSLSFWTPNINIFRDPRWGRGQETYGEDPYLTSKMGVAVVRGLQGYSYNGKPLAGPSHHSSLTTHPYRKLLACAKHFAVHSGPEWNRHSFNIEQLPERDLWETYLPAFKALVQEGDVAEIMCAYQRIDGDPCCANARIERQILRDEWGFQGLITSDCGAINDFYVPGRHDYSKDATEAAAKGVLAGTDVECGSVYRRLPDAVKRGDVSEADIDRSLRRLLIARFQLGDFDSDDLVPWTKIPPTVIASNEHKLLAYRMAQKSIVLLKNNGVLPLSPTPSTSPTPPTSPYAATVSQPTGKIAVMGPNANDSVMMWGNYSGYPTRTITALEGIREKLKVKSDKLSIPYIPACALTRNEVVESRFGEITSPLGPKGMQATYYNNTDLQGIPAATVTLTQPIRLSNGGNTVFAPGVNLENFSARLDGTFIPTQDETVTLNISGDDKLRLLVNGDTLVDIWNVRHRIQGAKKELTVKAGQHYRLQIDYVQEAGYGALNFDIEHKTTPTREQLLAQVGDAETVIFVGGISPSLEGEEMRVSEPGFRGGDRTSIELPQAQRDVLRMLHEAGKRVVFVNCSGGAMGLVPELESCDAIVQWWYGGEQGGRALADVLFGDYNPSGKLPVTFYKNVDELPDFLDYTMRGRTYRYYEGQPVFPFGHGLSYTTFSLSSPKFTPAKKAPVSATVPATVPAAVPAASPAGTVTLTAKNTGTREGIETIQVYIRNTADKEGPLKTLRAYRQVQLKPGQQQTVAIPLSRQSFEGWDAKTNTMRVIPGKYDIMVGNSSADAALQKISVNIK